MKVTVCGLLLLVKSSTNNTLNQPGGSRKLCMEMQLFNEETNTWSLKSDFCLLSEVNDTSPLLEHRKS